MFGTMLLVATLVLNLYVFWRASTVPLVLRYVPRKVIWSVGVGLALLFALVRDLGHGRNGAGAVALELTGMTWLAALFLTAVALLVVDLVTGFGWFAPRRAPALRGWALLAGALLSVTALIQGVRAPVVERYQVTLAGLPPALDGTVAIAISDLHVGSVLDADWLAARARQVAAERPDLVLLLGDLFEGHGAPDPRALEILRGVSAPLGVWAVTGNHESYGRRGGASDPLAATGATVLHDRWAEVRPGLILAGVDDLTSRRRSGMRGDPMSKALSGHPAGATLLLSHTPWNAEIAARNGAGLMLSGHTHAGQVWPFGLIERPIYPLLAGRYEVAGMPVIVGRGTGTWGPRMRLWRPSEIMRITLRAPTRAAT